MLLIFPAKQIRSKVIKEYMLRANIDKAVCFSCGNASKALIEAGVDTLDISPSGKLIANSWWKPEEISVYFKGYFDATSGHLPLYLMYNIGQAFKNHLGQLKGDMYQVPTGSGETIICLRLAYPGINFVPVYDLGPPTEYNKNAPLNCVVKALFS